MPVAAAAGDRLISGPPLRAVPPPPVASPGPAATFQNCTFHIHVVVDQAGATELLADMAASFNAASTGKGSSTISTVMQRNVKGSGKNKGDSNKGKGHYTSDVFEGGTSSDSGGKGKGSKGSKGAILVEPGPDAVDLVGVDGPGVDAGGKGHGKALGKAGGDGDRDHAGADRAAEEQAAEEDDAWGGWAPWNDGGNAGWHAKRYRK